MVNKSPNWDIRQTIENMKVIEDYLERQLRKADFEGCGESDVEELRYDFSRAIDALWKTTADETEPMKPIRKRKHDHDYLGIDVISCYYFCPNCESELETDGDYCPNCGQPLDWSDD